jgi:hypothetical protein
MMMMMEDIKLLKYLLVCCDQFGNSGFGRAMIEIFVKAKLFL